MTLGGPGAGSGALVDGIDVDAVAAAVRTCAGVDDLYSNPAATVASYLPGRQVAGVRVGSPNVTIQIRGRWGVPVPQLVAQVRAAVATMVGGRPVDVVIADVTDAPGGVGTNSPTDAGREATRWTQTPGPAPGERPAVSTSAPPTPTGVGIPISS